MAATARRRSAWRHRRPIPAGAGRKVKQPHQGRLRRHSSHAVRGRRRTPPRRSPRRSRLVAHPRSALSANAEPGRRNPNGGPGDPAHDHDVTRPAATGAVLGAASCVRPEPLKPRLQTHHDAGYAFQWSVAETPQCQSGALHRSQRSACDRCSAGRQRIRAHGWRRGDRFQRCGDVDSRVRTAGPRLSRFL